MKETRAEYLPISKLHHFDGHPFKVVDNEEMDQLTWSILTQGLLTPWWSDRWITGNMRWSLDTGAYTHAKRQESTRFLP